MHLQWRFLIVRMHHLDSPFQWNNFTVIEWLTEESSVKKLYSMNPNEVCTPDRHLNTLMRSDCTWRLDFCGSNFRNPLDRHSVLQLKKLKTRLRRLRNFSKWESRGFKSINRVDRSDGNLLRVCWIVWLLLQWRIFIKNLLKFIRYSYFVSIGSAEFRRGSACTSDSLGSPKKLFRLLMP